MSFCLFAGFVIGCGQANRSRTTAEEFPAVGDAAPSPAVADFNRRLQDRGSITFRSWNGQALRMDSDTELTFYADGSIHMFEWGFGLMGYTGEYRIYPDGRIIARFAEFGHEWPDMVVYRDGESLLLRPRDPRIGLVMGTRGGATIPPGKGSYWPFRMLTSEEEREVLDMIKEWRGRQGR